jgi:hypothetical protein
VVCEINGKKMAVAYFMSYPNILVEGLRGSTNISRMRTEQSVANMKQKY